MSICRILTQSDVVAAMSSSRLSDDKGDRYYLVSCVITK